MRRFAFAASQGEPAPVMARWSTLACAVLLSACAGSPHAAVPETQAAPAQRVAACDTSPASRSALQGVADELRAHGLQLQASCAKSGAGWVVEVVVVDGMKASKVVRGPLADGQALDMGTPAGVKSAAAGGAAATGFSPDVQFNREWLRTTMARHQFDNASDAWWLFARRGVGGPGAETDLAAR